MGGYKDDGLMLEVLLKRAMGMDVPEGTNEEYVRKRKWWSHVDSATWMDEQEDEVPVAMSVQICLSILLFQTL